MGKADLHVHTTESDGMSSVRQVLEHLLRNPTLEVVAITDHDSIEGGLKAKDMAARLECPFEVIVGAEITTREGHLVGLFLENPVPSLRPLAETLQAIHDQGGLAVLPHPMSWITFSVGQRSIEKVMASKEDGVYFDAIEVLNASVAGLVSQEKVKRLNGDRYRLAEVGSSDTHFLAALGRSYTLFPGASADDLRQSIISGSTQAAGGPVPFREYGWGQVIKQQVRSLVLSPGKTIGRPMLKLLKRMTN